MSGSARLEITPRFRHFCILIARSSVWGYTEVANVAIRLAVELPNFMVIPFFYGNHPCRAGEALHLR